MADFQEWPIVWEWKISADSIFLNTPLVKTLSTTVFAPASTVYASGSTWIQMYNTVDQTTNTEAGSLSWSSNAFTLQTLNAGSGAARTLQLRAFSGGNSTNISISKASAPFWNFFTSSSASAGNWIQMLSSVTASGSSWVQTFQAIIPTINQSSTAGFTILDLNPTLTATGSWAKNAILYRNASGSTLFGVSHLWKITFDTTMTAGGTTGNQTINKPSWSVNIAAGQAAITVTNSLVSATSLIHAYIRTADATMTFIKSVVAGAGSFVITCNANATAETSIGFIVYN